MELFLRFLSRPENGGSITGIDCRGGVVNTDVPLGK
jgi:hypothetical protein